jgi:hypothetical protein
MKSFLEFIALLILSIFWCGWVTATLWGWFFVPLGVPAIGVWHAFGIAALVGLLKGVQARKLESTTVERLTFGILAPAFALGFGWLAKVNM